MERYGGQQSEPTGLPYLAAIPMELGTEGGGCHGLRRRPDVLDVECQIQKDRVRHLQGQKELIIRATEVVHWPSVSILPA
jgi:hypothetical protein